MKGHTQLGHGVEDGEATSFKSGDGDAGGWLGLSCGVEPPSAVRAKQSALRADAGVV